mgnify:CR=1 FL=1
MAVYRGDQAQLTFGVEAAQGGDPEMMEGTAGTGATTINAAFEAGSRSITVAANTNFTVGDMIRIGTVASTATQTVAAHEVRRLESIDGTTFLLDRPTAFYHASGQEVKEITAIGGAAGRNDDNKFITFLPGVYETVDTPDPEMSIEGRRFLGTQSKRNWSVAYPGQQTLTGSVSGMVLLNGIPLRFPIGNVVTTPSAKEGGSLTLSAAAKKGDVYITASAGTGLAVGDYLNVDDGSTTVSEVRKLIANPTGNVWKLNAPLQFDHASGASIDEVSSGATYTHVINEAVDLDTVSWHVHMRDSSETAANDFDRRYVGGMIGSASLSAEEGGLVTMGWDGVNFLDMVHNQNSQTTVSTNLYNNASVTANMPRYSLMQAIDSDDIGEPGLNDNTGYPTTEPYYFSNGSVKFYGQEVARMRSFSLSISNGEEPRYYIGRQGDRHRGPYEIREGAREYSLTTSLALPDTVSSSSSSQAGALELFKQLLLEGHYGGTTAAAARAGFTVSLTLQRGASDKITIDIPGSTVAGTPTAGAAKLNEQGVFINSAPHNLTTDNPFQVDADMIFRSMKITIQDSVPVYP